ncbi:MAG: glycosyltransferase family 4 protein [Parvibaculales bacterium]
MNKPEKILDAAPSRMAEIADGAPLRILLPSYRSDPHTGGQGIYMRLISKALVDLGHHVDVISGPPYPELDPRIGLIKLPSLDMYARENPITCLNREIIGNKTDFFEWWSHNWGGFPEPYTFGVRMADYMRDKIDQYDIMHDNQTLCYGMLDVRDMGLPVVGTIHHPITKDRRIDIAHAKWPWIKFLKWRWYSFLNMQIKVARALDPLIVVSDSTKRDVHKDFKIPMQRMVRIHHGIDHELFTPQPHITRRKNRLMATASADVPLKGLIYLIRAYHILLADHPDLELVVVGRLREGQTMDELNRLGIRDRVKFISGLSGEDIRDLYAEATIAVSPSVYEGFGFPAGEALSCGVPLVATDGGSLPEVVGDAGIVVPHSNPPALACAIDGLLRDEDLRADMSVKARQHILDNFKWERCAREVVQLYRQTIAARKAA